MFINTRFICSGQLLSACYEKLALHFGSSALEQLPLLHFLSTPATYNNTFDVAVWGVGGLQS